MRILHTSDWHVGKRLRGESRHGEHEAVLIEIVGVADDESVDIVIVAGDLFESAAPTAESQHLVWRTLMDLHDTGARVVVIAGNHDHAAALESLRPFTGQIGITVAGQVRRPGDGGVLEVEARSGEGARVVLLPFLSQRYVVKAEHLMADEAYEMAGKYAGRYRAVTEALCDAGFADDTVNLVVAHCFVRGGTLGGGERDAQSIEDYWVDANVFPASANYVALGHLHRTQKIPGQSAVWYSGSPIQVDFGEEADVKHALLVETSPSTPARVTEVPLTGGERLRTITGTLDQLTAIAESGEVGDAWLRVRVEEAGRVGLAEEVRGLFPRAVEIRVERERETVRKRDRGGRTPTQLFGDYLSEQDVDDEAVTGLFAELYDEATT